MNRTDVKAALLGSLTTLNPRRSAEVALYVDTYLDYAEAQGNIDQHGAIVFHPRTGSPINNPYLAIRDRAARILERSKIATGYLWSHLEAVEIARRHLAAGTSPASEAAEDAEEMWGYPGARVYGFADGSAIVVRADGSWSIAEWVAKTGTFYEVDIYGARTGGSHRA